MFATVKMLGSLDKSGAFHAGAWRGEGHRAGRSLAGFDEEMKLPLKVPCFWPALAPIQVLALLSRLPEKPRFCQALGSPM